MGVSDENTPESHCKVTIPVALLSVAFGGVTEGADPTAWAIPPAAQCASICWAVNTVV